MNTGDEFLNWRNADLLLESNLIFIVVYLTVLTVSNKAMYYIENTKMCVCVCVCIVVVNIFDVVINYYY